jgi:hypothetical protein
MAIVANTYLTYSAVGIREDLSNTIYNISPTMTPFINNVGRGKVENTYFEWQTDALADAAADNAHLEGDETTFTAAVPTVRLANYCQISKKDVIVAGTLDAVNKAGRKAELAYQLAKKSAELKRDMEARACQDDPAVAGNSTTPRETAGFEAFIRTNVNDGGGTDPTLSGTTSGYPNAGPVAGTPRAFSETILKDVLAQMYASGAEQKMVILGAGNKQVFSGFAGIAQQRHQASSSGQTTIIGAADVYVGDFGELRAVPSRFSRNASALFVDPEYAEIVFLRPFMVEDLAKTGDAEKKHILVEWGLKIGTEKAHGIARDLT